MSDNHRVNRTSTKLRDDIISYDAERPSSNLYVLIVSLAVEKSSSYLGYGYFVNLTAQKLSQVETINGESFRHSIYCTIILRCRHMHVVEETLNCIIKLVG